MSYEMEHTEGSANVFADLGLEEADELLPRAELACQIVKILADRQLTQTAAARLLGTQQPRISDLQRGRLEGFSMERLIGFLNALGQDVEITVRPAAREAGRLLVSV